MNRVTVHGSSAIRLLSFLTFIPCGRCDTSTTSFSGAGQGRKQLLIRMSDCWNWRTMSTADVAPQESAMLIAAKKLIREETESLKQ